jgi:hypothetical protein
MHEEDPDEIVLIDSWSWQGMLALTLAIGVFLTVVAMTTAFAVKFAVDDPTKAINPIIINILTGVLSILIGSLATVLGKTQEY